MVSSPGACKPRRPQTKGKSERRFHFAEISLLNGRTFHTLEQLNEVTAWWLANVADVRVHGETKQTPLQRYAAEKTHLMPLPAQPYDTALVLYRSVNAEGFIPYRQNFYAVPWCYIGRLLPVRITAHEVVVYSPTVEEVTRHALLPRTVSGQRQIGSSHPGRADQSERLAILQERFQELGPAARRFFDGLLAKQRQGKYQAQHILALWPTTSGRTGWPLWSAPFASAPILWLPSSASWPPAPNPRASWPAWPNRNGSTVIPIRSSE